MIEPQRTPVGSKAGVVVAAYDYGGSGPDVVFAHATGFHGRCWDPIIDRLGGRYRCLALDFRGHGDSPVPPDLEIDWWDMAGDLLAVLDHFGLERARAVGHSMGAASIVMAELERPGTFEVAWLFEPILFPRSREGSASPGNPLAAAARRRREIFASRDAAFERYASRPPLAQLDPEALRAYVESGFEDLADGTVGLKCRRETEARTFEASITGAFERLGELGARLTIAGSGDGGAPALIAPTIASLVPGARYEPYEDLTHFAPMEDLDRVTEAIVATLG